MVLEPPCGFLDAFAQALDQLVDFVSGDRQRRGKNHGIPDRAADEVVGAGVLVGPDAGVGAAVGAGKAVASGVGVGPSTTAGSSTFVGSGVRSGAVGVGVAREYFCT